MNNDFQDLTGRLDDLASQPALPPEPEFVAALESRLRMRAQAHTQTHTQTHTQARKRRRPAAPRRFFLAGTAVTAIAAAVAIGAVIAPGALSRPRVQLAGAIDTQVIGPDGRVGEAAPGAVIADGSILRTGPSGQTQAGGVVIGPDREAIAVDGRLHPVTSDAAKDRRTTADDGGHATLHLTVRQLATSDELRWTRYTGRSLYGYLVLRTSNGMAPDSNRDAVAFTTGTSSVQRGISTATYRVVAVDRQGGVLAASDPVTAGAS